MKVTNIKKAKLEAQRFLDRLEELEESQSDVFKDRRERTYTSKETGALKRSSMDLTRSLSVMRNNIWEQ